MLELGAGYGRLIPELTQTGRRVVALELDPELLAAARRNTRALPARVKRAVRFVRADMRSFAFAQRFERVILPYNGLYCLLTKRDALACFRAVRGALDDNGIFAFDIWNAEPFRRASDAGTFADDTEPVVTLDYAGRTWDVFERSRVRRGAQRLDVTYDYVPRGGGVPSQIAIAQRYYSAEELASLLGRAGFVVQARYGNFASARFTANSPHLLVLARAV